MNLSEAYDPYMACERTRVKKIGKELCKLLPDNLDDVAFVCIGTMNVPADSLGPFVGRYLTRRGVQNVYGTQENPFHGANVNAMIKTVDKPFIVVINAARAGRADTVGRIEVCNEPMRLGAGVGRKDLPTIGNVSIIATTFYPGSGNVNFALHAIKIETVDMLASIVGRGIRSAIRFHEQRQEQRHVL